MYSNGYLIGNISNKDFAPISINNNSEVTIPLKIRLGIVAVVNDLLNAWNNRSLKQEIKVDLIVNVNGEQIKLPPMNYEIG